MHNIRWVAQYIPPKIQLHASSSSNTAKCLDPHVFSSSIQKNLAVFSPISRVLPNWDQSSARRSVKSSMLLASLSNNKDHIDFRGKYGRVGVGGNNEEDTIIHGTLTGLFICFSHGLPNGLRGGLKCV